MKIKNYENYWICKDGSVIGARRTILKPDTNSTGYHRVTLSKEGKTKRFFVHRLVAEHFVEKASDDLVVNHIDGDRTNNHVNNLEWVTRSRNVKDGWERGRDSSHLYLNFRK